MDRVNWAQGIPATDAEAIRTTCRQAWEKGMLAGFNGNVSLRLGDTVLVTRSGAAKGMLGTDDLCLIRLSDNTVIAGSKPSSEYAMHAAIYNEQPQAMAIVHTHPPKLLALGTLLPPEQRLDIPVYEAEPLSSRMGFAPDYLPGTVELAHAVGLQSRKYEAIWMERHGLTAWGSTLTNALGLSEELEHLAGIKLMLLQHRV